MYIQKQNLYIYKFQKQNLYVYISSVPKRDSVYRPHVVLVSSDVETRGPDFVKRVE